MKQKEVKGCRSNQKLAETIEKARDKCKLLVHQLADAVTALCDAKGTLNFAAHDTIYWSDCTVHIAIFVDPKLPMPVHRKKRNAFKGERE